MKDIPIIFPMALAVIMVATFFMGAYAISADTLKDPPLTYAATARSPTGEAESDPAQEPAQRHWYQEASIWVCPLH